MLLFWKLVDETQMVKPLEPTSHHNSKKYFILLPLRAIYIRSLHYETPCSLPKPLSKAQFFIKIWHAQKKRVNNFEIWFIPWNLFSSTKLALYLGICQILVQIWVVEELPNVLYWNCIFFSFSLISSDLSVQK